MSIRNGCSLESREGRTCVCATVAHYLSHCRTNTCSLDTPVRITTARGTEQAHKRISGSLPGQPLPVHRAPSRPDHPTVVGPPVCLEADINSVCPDDVITNSGREVDLAFIGYSHVLIRCTDIL